MSKKNFAKKAIPISRPSPEEAMEAVKTLLAFAGDDGYKAEEKKDEIKTRILLPELAKTQDPQIKTIIWGMVSYGLLTKMNIIKFI